MAEIWKDIKGYEGIYQVSNLGRVCSLDRYVNSKYGSKRFVSGGMLKLQSDKYGYNVVCLSKGKRNKRKLCKVHRLVAKAFIPNPNKKTEVNHMNGVRDDNRVENLEWVTSSENMVHSFRVLKRKFISPQKGRFGKDNKTSKTVIQIDGESVIAIFCGTKEAERKTGINRTSISMVCNNKRPFAGGFKWKFKE